jgi:hypothetical protein
MSWLNKNNIQTQLIEESIGVTRDVAKRVHEEINKHYNFDWSEATLSEIKLVSLDAFENLNENHIF